MTRKWKTVRVFISSTFRDMHAERDHLVRFVFPELRERCAKRRLHLVDVDLRWGVTEDEAEQGRVLEVCLDEIERCRPFFVGLLGERYGWVPPRYNVPDEPSYDWVRDFQPGHSITAIEIYHGVLRDPEAHARAFFYFRDPAFISEVPAQHQAIFLPDNEQAKSKLDELKDEIRRHCVVRENYQCGYGGTDATGNVMLTGLEAFGRHVLEDLWAAIGQEYPEHQTFVDELAIERAYHEAFIESRSQRFIGRQDLLSRMFEYLDDEASVLVVTGAAGCGKSALLANFASQYASHPEVFVLPHFIGVSPRSTDLHRTLLRLCRELAERFQIADEIPEDYQELRQKMPGILEEACSRANVLLILDGLNQLDESHYAHSMNWLPQTLPRRLKLIASTLEGECLDALRSRKPTPEEIVIGALDLEDRKRIVGQTLGDYRKRLDEDRVDERYGNTQMGLLLTKRESDNPLYLIVACEELRVFGDFERLMERIAGLPDDVAGLFEQVLRRLEGDQGEELVRSALSLLECSRHGLLESEMLQLLARAGEEQLPPSIWARLYRSLQFYLRPPGEGSESALDFFHRQLSKAVRKKYLASEDDGVIIHRRLADCFYRKADPTADGMWKANDPRALSELPYHLSQAQRYDELFRIAGDETFLNAQASAFATEPDLQMETLRSAIKGAARIDSAAKMAEFVLAHARRLKEVYSESPLDALRAGNLERAWELADLSESEPCVLWLLLLACELKDAGQPDQARTTVIRLQQRHRPPMKDWKNELGGHLLRQLAEIWSEGANTTEAQDNAHLVDSLRDSLGVREFLKPAEASSRALDAPAGPGIDMPQTDFETAIEVAGSLDDKRDRAKAFCAFAVAQARAGEVESSRKNFSAAIESAFEIDDVWHEADEPEQGVKRLGYRAEALSEIAASQAQIGDFTAASTTARSIDENTHLVNALSAIAVAQTQAGAKADAFDTFTAASEVASKIEEIQDRAIALSAVASARAEAGDIAGSRSSFDSAIETALKIDDQGSRHVDFRAGALVVIGLAQERAIDRAAARTTFALSIQTSHPIDDWRQRAEALRDIAGAAAQMGDTEAARSAFEAAIESASRIEYDWDRKGSLCDVALAQAQAGDFTAALQTLERIGDWWHRTEALQAIAGAQAQSGDFDGAIETAMSIPNGYERQRSDALCVIAKAQAEAGDFNAALRSAELVDGPSARSQVLSAIASAQGEAGDFSAALAVAGELQEKEDQIGALCAIAAAQRQAGEAAAGSVTLSSASQLARTGRFLNQFLRARALSAVAAAQALAGAELEASENFAAAKEEVERVEETPWARLSGGQAPAAFSTDFLRCAEALREIAIAQASAKRFAAALETAEGILQEEDERAKALVAIAKAQAQSRDHRSAVNTARRIGDAERRARALCEIAEAQANGGEARSARDNLAEAIELVNQMTDQKWRGKGLATIAITQARSGFGEEALHTASMILTDRDSRLSEIAQALADIGDKANFKRLLTPCAYYLNAAYRICGFVVRLYPEQATAVAAVVKGSRTHETPSKEPAGADLPTTDPQRAYRMQQQYQNRMALWKAWWKRLMMKRPKGPPHAERQKE